MKNQCKSKNAIETLSNILNPIKQLLWLYLQKVLSSLVNPGLLFTIPIKNKLVESANADQQGGFVEAGEKIGDPNLYCLSIKL
ncbi:MAG: hypothetical protein GF353_00990 [Candidatus Lokiarchaeota archaeon]|nr:hypothetical protein [Candidatus Lokiarchaeota archaeon]